MSIYLKSLYISLEEVLADIKAITEAGNSVPESYLMLREGIEDTIAHEETLLARKESKNQFSNNLQDSQEISDDYDDEYKHGLGDLPELPPVLGPDVDDEQRAVNAKTAQDYLNKYYPEESAISTQAQVLSEPVNNTDNVTPITVIHTTELEKQDSGKLTNEYLSKIYPGVTVESILTENKSSITELIDDNCVEHFVELYPKVTWYIETYYKERSLIDYESEETTVSTGQLIAFEDYEEAVDYTNLKANRLGVLSNPMEPRKAWKSSIQYSEDFKEYLEGFNEWRQNKLSKANDA